MQKIFLNWQVAKSANKTDFDKFFQATVPGNVQLDYAKENGFAEDWFFGGNFRKFNGLEDNYWKYRTVLTDLPQSGSNFFVAKGIDYQFDIFLDGEKVHSQEGMFTPVRLSLEKAKEGSVLEILIYPAPKNPIEDIYALDQSRIPMGRSEADRSAKPAVCYGWDFHPRLIVQGIWDEAYIENVPVAHIQSVDIDYEVTEINEKKGVVALSIKTQATNGTTKYYLYDENGNLIVESDKNRFSANVNLWFPHNLGKQPIYRLRTLLKNENGETVDTFEKKIGFRKVQLVMNENSWDFPNKYPMSRSACPFTLCVNDKKIFAKGSNFVNPEVFVGTITEETYRSQLTLVKDCNMNILRLWGGAIVNKDSFFEICDELGIMVWQEFPLACNNYIDDKNYLRVLEQEATSIIKKIKSHPCHVVWCGGNELFNSWSMMTDQSLALRLLNKLCLELDTYTPFLPTSPVHGVKHGPYSFSIYGQDVFHLFNDNDATGYIEFGMSAMANYEELCKFMPKKALEKFENTQDWRDHFAFAVEGRTLGHADYDSVCKYFGKTEDVKEFIRYSQFLMSAGYIYVFEEARRQVGCSMAMNWCFNEPWYCSANNSLLSYGNAKKPTYDAVKTALSPVTPSLRMSRFDYKKGDTFQGEVHLLNDSGKPSGIDVIEVYLDYGVRKKIAVLSANNLDKNEYCGNIGFAIDDELLSGKTVFENNFDKQFIYIVLKTKLEEKKYPISITKYIY